MRPIAWRGGARLSRNDLLLEVAFGDVAPHVTAEVEQNGVAPADGVEELGDAVVRLDLRHVLVPLEAERGDELLRKGRPVRVRAGHQVRLVRARGAGDLAEQRRVTHLRHAGSRVEGQGMRQDVGQGIGEGMRQGTRRGVRGVQGAQRAGRVWAARRLHLLSQPVDHVGELFAHRRGRGGLAVRVREHRHLRSHRAARLRTAQSAKGARGRDA